MQKILPPTGDLVQHRALVDASSVGMNFWVEQIRRRH